jgi:hypothetical protein
MRTKFFFLAMLASVAASAQTLNIKITAIDYTKKIATCDLSWTGRNATHLSDVWVFVDYIEVFNNAPTGTWKPAAITGATVTQNNTGTAAASTVSGNTRGIWIKSVTSGANFTGKIALQFSNVPAKFNACAYATDYPPNATITTAGYQLKGSPPFTITYNNGSSTITSNQTFALGCINTLTDATGCPGLVGVLSAPTSSVDGSRCNAGTVSISATPPSGCTIDWYTTASGTTKVTNGTGVTTLTTPSISTTTDYYAASRHLVTGCVSSSRRTVTATVTTSSGRDVAPNSCGCASGLTIVGSYCRDLVADAASTYTCSGAVLEVKNSPNPRSEWNVARTTCSSIGWRLPTYDEAVCLINAGRIIWGHCYDDGEWRSKDWWVSNGTGCRTGSTGSNQVTMDCSNRWTCSGGVENFCVRN